MFSATSDAVETLPSTVVQNTCFMIGGLRIISNLDI
jgi:hypothetical protein